MNPKSYDKKSHDHEKHPKHDIQSPIRAELIKEFIEEVWSHRPHLRWGEMFKTPDVNLYTDRDQLVLEAALPGFESDEIQVVVTDTDVTIKAERESEQKSLENRHYLAELDHSKFYRSLHLPMEVKSGQSEASYAEGILSVTMPLGNPELHRPVVVNVESKGPKKLAINKE